MTTKATSLRLAETQAAELAVAARADGMKMSEVVRIAIDKHIAERRSDPGFQKRLKRLIEEDRETLERLKGE
jgi:post-segregation antitoxin (ccd killing protein)